MDTRALCSTSAMLLAILLVGYLAPAGGRRVHLGNCAVTVHVHELRHESGDMRRAAVMEDKQTGVQLLSNRMMKELQPLESCCFLKHLLDFYVEKVFSSYAVIQPKFRRNTSNLANSFISIKKDLHQCHTHMKCPCGGEARVRLGAVRDAYDKMEPSDATVKAIGELDSVLQWMESFGDSSKHAMENPS